MNLYAVSADPVVCAQSLDDARLDKAIIDSGKIISTVLADDGVKNLPHKPIEMNSLIKWASSTNANLSWTLRYHRALCDEYTYRTAKINALQCAETILTYATSRNAPETFVGMLKINSRHIDFSWIDDIHAAYRMMMTALWMSDEFLPHWKKRNWPTWFEDDAFHDYQHGMMFVNRAKELIGSAHEGSTHCPRCGGKMKYESQRNFKCMEDNGWFSCLRWTEAGKWNHT